MSVKSTVKKLREAGLCEAADRLAAVGQRLEQTAGGLSWLDKGLKHLNVLVGRQRENLQEEWGETERMLDTVRKSVLAPDKVAPKERDEAVDQFKDLLKTVPASAILVGTFMIPIPGAQPILTPILMKKLGLFPSAWSRDSMERDLREVAALARELGHPELADEVLGLEGQVKALDNGVGDLRRFLKDHPELQVFFDEDLDNKVTERELRSLQGRVKDCARLAAAEPDAKVWYLYVLAQCDTVLRPAGDGEGEDRILGPLAFSAIRQRYATCPHALLRHQANDWWLPLSAVLGQINQ